MESLLSGSSLGRYQLLEEIGRGGMATVFRAFDPVLERHVALKAIPSYRSENPTFADRFRNEARAVASLHHPHIVDIHDFGEDKGFLYLVMELLTGGTLRDRLGAPMSPGQAAEVLTPVAAALDHAHGRGLVHRDVKPSNVLFGSDGRPVLSDFGLVRLISGGPDLTLSGTVVGTPEYMSPEQALGKAVDSRSDLYSLGVMAYEMLVGRPPFTGGTPTETLMSHIHEPAPMPTSINQDLDPRSEAALVRALAKDPGERPQSALALVGALVAPTTDGQNTGEPSHEETPTRFDELQEQASAPTDAPTWRVSPRFAIVSGAVVIAVAAVVVGTVVVLNMGDRGGDGEGGGSTNTGANASSPVVVATGVAAPATRTAAPVATLVPARSPVAVPLVASAELESLVSETLDRTVSLRGLELVPEITVLYVDRQEFLQRQRSALEAMFTDPLAAAFEMDRILGLFPAETDIFRAARDIFVGQRDAYYDSTDKKIYVSMEPLHSLTILEVTLAGEYTLAIEEQGLQTSLFEALEMRPSTEEWLGQVAVLMGHAAAIQIEYVVTYFTPAQQAEVLASQFDNPALEQAPYFVRRFFDFIFNGGSQLVQALRQTGGWEAVTRIHRDPPKSTEQVLHPEKFLIRENPMDVSLPDLRSGLGPGWIEIGGASAGEWLLKTYLETLVRRLPNDHRTDWWPISKRTSWITRRSSGAHLGFLCVKSTRKRS